MSQMEVVISSTDATLQQAINALNDISDPIDRDLAQAQLISYIGQLFYAKAYCRKDQRDRDLHRRAVRRQIKDKGQVRAGD